MSKGSTTARVRVTFVMECEAGAWSDDSPLGQLRKQARDEAHGAADRLVRIARENKIGLTVEKFHEPTIITTDGDGR